jgi:5-methylthioribose kinase
MPSYDSYFLMKSADAAEFARERLKLFPAGARLEHAEIGDGNLNYIFRVRDPQGGRSVVLKQAGGTARISDQFKVSTDRTRIEYEALRIENELAPGMVPVTYGYDPVMNCCAMEDLSDHVIMRTGLLQRNRYPRFADHITTFMANTLLLTTDMVMDHKKKKALVGSFINPDLCEITEDLVYTEPFDDLRKRNDPFPPNREWLERRLYQDEALRLETAKLKLDFFNNAQSLVHGDLHTGSIFVRQDSTKVIDGEFSFYGPAGYDVGNVIANLVFAWANADTVMADPAARGAQTQWLEETLVEVVEGFKRKWKAQWRERVAESTARTPGFAEWYLWRVLSDSAGVTGLELCRRTVGIAHVKDLTSIESPPHRLRAERLCIDMARRCILERDRIVAGDDYLALLRWAAERHPRPA